MDSELIQLGKWSPDGRRVTFWTGINSLSIAADGLPLWVVEVRSGKVSLLAPAALVNLRYQGWAPDSSALAFTAGGDRSAQTHKWLSIYDAKTGRTRIVIKERRQVPGIVSWSPHGDWIAYAANSPRKADDGSMRLSNPAIADRRIYLLNPKTGQHHRLNRVESYQDAPRWGGSEDELFYVERHADRVSLMVANPAAGIGKMAANADAPADHVGYYGQADWDELLGRWKY